jgi:hypothetical protein
MLHRPASLDSIRLLTLALFTANGPGSVAPVLPAGIVAVRP